MHHQVSTMQALMHMMEKEKVNDFFDYNVRKELGLDADGVDFIDIDAN